VIFRLKYNKMNPYITTLNRTNYFENIIGEYGDYQWDNGFYVGYITGFCVSTVFCVIIFNKNK